MVCETSLSNMFRGVMLTDNLIQSILEKPVTYNGRNIGAIIGVNPEADTISMEIDDRYACEFIKVFEVEFEFVVR